MEDTYFVYDGNKSREKEAYGGGAAALRRPSDPY